MSGIIRAIIVMSISGGVLAALLFILKPLVKNHLPKSAQYYLWLVVIAALLIPVSRIVTLPAANAGSAMVASPVSVVDRYVVSSAESSERMAAIPAAQGLPENNNHHVPAATQAANPAVSIIDIFMLVYPFGAAIALLYFIISYLVFINLYRRRNKDANAEETAMLAVLCGDRRVPRLYRNPLAITPMLIGVLQPTIILPDRDYTDEQLYSVLLHELTHHKRKDIFIKWLSVLACVVHWFNPLAWLVRREIDRACELACDEAVIRNLDHTGKQKYGDTLLYVAARLTGRQADAKMPQAVLSTTMCEEKKALKERLGAIMKSKKHSRLAVVLSAILIVAAILTACALGAGRADTQYNQDLIEFEAVYSDVTEASYSVQFKYKDILYLPYIVDGVLQSAGTRGLKEVGFAVGDFSGTVREGQKDEYRIFEREGYSIDEFIVVQDSMTFMNPATIHVAVQPDVPESPFTEPETGNTLAPISIIIQSASPEGLTYQFENRTGNEYTYGEDFALHIRENDNWRSVDPIIENWGFEGIGYDIEPQSRTDLKTIDWQRIFGQLPPGDYQIQKNVLYIRAPGDYDTFVIDGYFRIPHDIDSDKPWMSAWQPLSDLPTDFNMEQALADGLVVIGYDGTHNQQLVDRFYDDVASGGGAAFMRVMQQTREGDAIITDYQYDGNVFTVTHDSTRDKFSAASDRIISTMTYKYLVPHDRSRPYGVPLPYYLSNEENIYTATSDGQGMTLIEDLWWVPPPLAGDKD